MSIPLKLKIRLEFFLNNGLTHQEVVIMEKGKTESLLHIVLKLLAFLYFYKTQKRLIIEPSFRYRDFKPDLVSFKKPENPREVTSEVDIWIECKKVKISKLSTLVRYLPSASIYWFHLSQIITRKMKNEEVPPKVKLIGIEITKKDLALLESSILTQSPSWSVHRYEHSQFIIDTLHSEIHIKFQNIR